MKIPQILTLIRNNFYQVLLELRDKKKNIYQRGMK